jgi:rare lipoprotein A
VVAPVSSPARVVPSKADMRRWGWGVLWVIVAVGVEGCMTSPPTPVTLATVPPPRPATETGRASWYGEAHHGLATASGERFDMNALTAAHRTLPFGTRLRVVNLDNDREVEVRINDRGPVAPGRIIDLSYAAARALGAVGTGVVSVRLIVVGGPGMAPQTPPDARNVPAKP